jgi:hypothetical protein
MMIDDIKLYPAYRDSTVGHQPVIDIATGETPRKMPLDPFAR